MGRRSRIRHHLPYRRVLLDQTSVAEIQATRKRVDAILKCYWEFHSELAYQRKLVQAELYAALTRAATSGFELDKFQRAVKYCYGLHPFSAVGSLADPGGRFNIGDIDPSRFPRFAALYLARDKDTALQETLGQGPPLPGAEGLTPQELALTNAQSETIVSISGRIDTVFDLREPDRLQGVVDLIRGFELSPGLVKEATRLGLELKIARTVDQLFEAILTPDWMAYPMCYDQPATSQIFGQVAMLAGIEGIVYPSKFTGAVCVAVFPESLASSRSYFEIDDRAPHPKVPTRIDSSNWQVCLLTANDVIK